MKNCLILFLLIFSSTIFAQDTIVRKDGANIIGKVYEVKEREIKYKKSSNLDGPIYTMPIKDIITIIYENGEKDDFTITQSLSVKHKKKEPQIIENYSKISLGYACFGIKDSGNDIDDLNYTSKGASLLFTHSFKPINNIELFFELGFCATITRADDVLNIYNKDDSYKDNAKFKYFSISVPLNIKYRISIPKTHIKFYPYLGVYVKRIVDANQKYDWGNFDFIKGTFTIYGIGSGAANEIQYKKIQGGWQVGLDIEYKNIVLSGYFSRDFKNILSYESHFYELDKGLLYGYDGYQFGISLGYQFNTHK